ncbi:DEAD/DEAH box helicase family protein [Methanococcoides sp. AM1]|uniref:DEAD/DEAH box helicase family protein n=1 Tax=Methanococcoides sp. AM1 TaxID=1201011 RepID=UPI001083C853|nr:DEAD/DEAH box helicase family protein [Methanococcoides sp. AM1]
MVPANNKKVRLDDYLVLNNYMNKLFGMENFDEFQKILKNVEDGFDDEGRSYVFNVLYSQKSINSHLRTKLEEYDSNIKEYVDYINIKQETPIRLKYFQYLSVLFTEIYLDRYFDDPIKLMNGLTPSPEEFIHSRKKNKDFNPSFVKKDLKKLAFWMATGAGKTFLLHINYLQFMKYNQGPNKIELDNILLVTPTESLSKQHIEEMQKSSIPCELFRSQNIGPMSQYAGHNVVKVIDIHKLTDEKKGQGVTIDIESFGQKNLIFVDEGHKGSGGNKWKYFREELSKEGFAFEYSATFGQAVAAANKKDSLDLLHKYGKSIIFDYSYRYFHSDGYGKEFSILNLKDSKYSEPTKHLVMLANLLTLYEQKVVFEKYFDEIEEYNIEDPLWVFVGSKVQGKQNQSDILEVIKFFDLALNNKENWTVDNIKKILSGNSGLKDKNDRDIFLPTYPEQRLGYLRDGGYTPEVIFKDVLKRIFHSENKAPLYLFNIKNAAGEIALKCGLGEYFGVINIGDDAQFLKLAEKAGINTNKDEMGTSLFNDINKKNSNINVLIGAKKFIEGWNSWRVSNMGLLNIGKSEGTQIIQLFGRGVRLRGKNHSLKRSKAVDEYAPESLHVLEKLNIFGIEANYMDQFKEYLENEGLPSENYVDIPVPIKLNTGYLKEDLLIPYVDKKRFRKEDFFEVKADENIKQVEVDLMPKIEIIESQENRGIGAQSETKAKVIEHKYLDLLDWSRIYFSLLEFKVAKSWNNMIFSKEVLREIIERNENTYFLKCPDDDITPTKFEDVWHLEEIVVSILKKYLQSVHNRHRNVWTKSNIDAVPITESNGNFEFRNFRVTVNENDVEIIDAINSLKENLRKESFEELYAGDEVQYVPNVYFEKHLYQPLFVKDESNSPKYKIVPDSLNKGENEFLLHLKKYVQQNKSKFSEQQELFVLRNIPRKGVGFFVETLNYYPDFIVWIKKNDKQHIIFADPKGLAKMYDNGFEDEKIKLHEYIKNIESILAEKLEERGVKQKIVLDSYIISGTPFREVQTIFHTNSRNKYEENHIFFLEEGEKYVSKMLDDKL